MKHKHNPSLAELLTQAATRLLKRYQQRYPEAPFITTFDIKFRWCERGTAQDAARRLA